MRWVVASVVIWASCSLATGCGGRADGGAGTFVLEDAGHDATRDAISDGHTVPGDARDEPATCNAVLSDLEGNFLLALSTTLDPSLPILFDAHVVMDGPQAQLYFQPLSATDRKTPVGPAQSSAPFQVAADRSFRVDLGSVVVPLEADPLSRREIELDAVLLGHLCQGPTFWCGELDAAVTRPIALDLTGSMWTLEPAASAAYPEPPHIDCQGSLAVAVEQVNPQ